MNKSSKKSFSTTTEKKQKKNNIKSKRMAKKSKKIKKPRKRLTKEEKALIEQAKREEQRAIMDAKIYANGEFLTPVTLRHIFTDKRFDFTTLIEQFDKQINGILSGNTTRIEIMLFTQASALQALFNYAAQHIASCPNVPMLQAYSELAMSANNACRRTLLALHQIKNPASPVSIKEQNNTLNQQINKCCEHEVCSEKKVSNELLSLEKMHHETLDTGITRRTSKNDKELATVGTIHRATNKRRKTDC